jgi:hypothetical protein
LKTLLWDFSGREGLFDDVTIAVVMLDLQDKISRKTRVERRRVPRGAPMSSVLASLRSDRFQFVPLVEEFLSYLEEPLAAGGDAAERTLEVAYDDLYTSVRLDLPDPDVASEVAASCSLQDTRYYSAREPEGALSLWAVFAHTKNVTLVTAQGTAPD